MTCVLVSACLLGTAFRYDGKEKENPQVRKLLEREDLVLIPACPEQLGGLPTPRLPSERKEGRVENSQGRGVTAELLEKEGIAVIGESELEKLDRSIS